MSARILNAVVTLVVAANIASASAFAASEPSAQKIGAGPDQIAAISAEAYEKMLQTSVEDDHSVKQEQGNTLRVELASDEKVLFFTRPGHPAHPAVVEVAIVEDDGHPSLNTTGWWAGDAEAYRDWYHAFKRRNARLSRQWQRESGPF